MFAFLDQACEEQCRGDAMGDSLTGVAGREVDPLALRAEPDECRIVGRVEALAGPAIANAPHLGKALAPPLLQGLESRLAIVDFAGAMVRAANQKQLAVRKWVQPHVVIGILG